MNRLTFIVSLAMFFGPATVHAVQNENGFGGLGSSECTYDRKLNADLGNGSDTKQKKVSHDDVSGEV